MAADRREQIPGWKRDFRLFLSAPIPAVLLGIIHKDQGTWITLWGWSWRSLPVWGWQNQDPTWNIKYSQVLAGWGGKAGWNIQVLDAWFQVWIPELDFPNYWAKTPAWRAGMKMMMMMMIVVVTIAIQTQGYVSTNPYPCLQRGNSWGTQGIPETSLQAEA